MRAIVVTIFRHINDNSLHAPLWGATITYPETVIYRGVGTETFYRAGLDELLGEIERITKQCDAKGAL